MVVWAATLRPQTLRKQYMVGSNHQTGTFQLHLTKKDGAWWNIQQTSWHLAFLHISAIILLMEEIFHHLGYKEPNKIMDDRPIKWCRISSINSIIGVSIPSLLKPSNSQHVHQVPGPHRRSVSKRPAERRKSTLRLVVLVIQHSWRKISLPIYKSISYHLVYTHQAFTRRFWRKMAHFRF